MAAGDEDGPTVVTTSSWGSRLGGSLLAAVLGLCLFLGSFWLLSWNEGRAIEAIANLEDGARAVRSVPAAPVDRANEGALVHVSGATAVAGPLADTVFQVGGPDLLRLRREVEMYQWRQHEESETTKSVGGTETTTTRYSYVREWSAEAIDSGGFKKPQGHANPSMPYRSAGFDARAVRLGDFALGATELGKLSGFEPLPPPAEGAAGRLPQGFRWVGETLYRGADPEAPQVGDLRVRFRAIPVQPVTVVARQAGTALAPFPGRNGREIDLVRAGTWDATAMFEAAKAEERQITWLLRGGGFLMMLFGLLLMTRPLTWLTSLLPFLESITGTLGFVVALAIAVPLTLFTIALAWIAHRPLLAAGLLAAGVAAWLLLRRLRTARARAAAPAPAVQRMQ